MSACRSCGAAIWWGITAAGKAMPIDVEPTADGNVVRTGQMLPSRNGDYLPEVEVRAVEPQPFDAPEDNAPRFTSHFATCPHADEHRRAR